MLALSGAVFRRAWRANPPQRGMAAVCCACWQIA